MLRHPESPFVSSRVPFHDLRYFPPDPAFRVMAHLDRLATPTEAYLRTNRDGSAVMRYLGDLHFRIAGSDLALRLYHAGEGVGTSVFVPFRDVTSGRDSYGPGRYLILELNESDDYEVDFNRAFNPYCAYSDDFECAFPPAENDLSVPIRAGEKVWAPDQNPATPSSIMIEAVKRFRAARQLPSQPKSSPRRVRSTGAGTARGSRSRRTARRPRRASVRGPGSSRSRRRARSSARSTGRSGRSRTKAR